MQHHGDDEIQEFMCSECYSLINSILGVHYNEKSWSLNFLLDYNILTEIICLTEIILLNFMLRSYVRTIHTCV